jgi:hypothetical protein
MSCRKVAVLTPFGQWDQAREHGAKDKLIVELTELRGQTKDKDEARRLADLIPALEAMTLRRWLRRTVKRQRTAGDPFYAARRRLREGIVR